MSRPVRLLDGARSCGTAGWMAMVEEMTGRSIEMMLEGAPNEVADGRDEVTEREGEVVQMSSWPRDKPLSGRVAPGAPVIGCPGLTHCDYS
jgi:hypothetical protein